MGHVVVVGAGIGGMAAAARLAKLGHRVTVCERTASAGGCLRSIESAGFRWDAGPTSTTLPAAVRDLFRTSGRPIERYVDLQLRTPARRHVFDDGSVVDLAAGNRGQQAEAVSAGLGAGSGQRWASFVDGQAAVWEVLRRQVLDRADGGTRFAERGVARALSSRTSLARLLKTELKDERLQAMAAHSVVVAGSVPKNAPAFAAVDAYVERSFGVWSAPSGMAALGDALVVRLDERGVDVRYNSAVTWIVTSDDRVVGVETESGERVSADIVVTDIDPRVVLRYLVDHPAVRGARQTFVAATPAIPPTVVHLGLSGDLPSLPEEVVLHGEPLLVLTTSGSAPPGQAAWTVWLRGSVQEDVLTTLAQRGIDVRENVVTRVDRSAVDLVAETGGSSYGLAWAGWRAHAQRSALGNPLPGLHLLGAGMHPSTSIPYVVWGAAHVAERIGRA